MTLEDLTLDLEQHVDINASPEKAASQPFYIDWEKAAPDSTASLCLEMLLEPRARRTLVPRSRQRHWPPVGLCADHQASNLVGAEWANVHVVSGR